MIINRKSIINLPSRNSVHRFGIQCESEFSAQIFLTEIGIQCWSEFRPSRNSVREPQDHLKMLTITARCSKWAYPVP